MKQQELADAIGINMQSLSKIERGVNYPTFDTLEKIMDVLEVTPNELLSGEWKFVQQAEKEVCKFLRTEERLNAELKHGHYDNFFDSEEEWLEYELEQLRKYITDYIKGEDIQASDLYPIKTFIQHLKFQKVLDRYDDLYSMDKYPASRWYIAAGLVLIRRNSCFMVRYPLSTSSVMPSARDVSNPVMPLGASVIGFAFSSAVWGA